MVIQLNTIILSAGKFNPKNISMGMINEQGLLPIRGKAAINWCIDDVLAKGFKNVKVVLRKNNSRLSNFLSFNYPTIQQIFVGDHENLFHSLSSVLTHCDENLPTQIILGDTLINEPFPVEDDVFLSSPNVRTSSQWCLISKDDNMHIKKIYNKEKDISLANKEALVGYYKISNTKLLKKITDEVKEKNEDDFLKVFAIYNKQIPIVVKTTNNWFDFGHVSGTVQARLELFNAREFNNIKVDSVKGTIIKSSKKKQKLLDEANWYNSLPKEISCFAPRVFNVIEDEETVSLEMELYGYANLAEIFIYGSNNLEDWYHIIDSLLKVHQVFEQYTIELDPEEIEEIYVKKTIQRLNEIDESIPYIKNMMVDDYIVINNIHYKNFNVVKNDLFNYLEKLQDYSNGSIVHGDYCFSNILFDPMHYIFKLIDPRGRFKTQTIYGDPRYDIAKLRHSVVGLYDFIVAGLFQLDEIEINNYDFHILAPSSTSKLEIFFDELVINYGYNSQDIRMIEALLFLTMIPLHSDAPTRQKCFYLTAIRKINEVLYNG